MFANTVKKAIYSLYLSLYKNGIGCPIENICFGEFYWWNAPILNRNSCKALYKLEFISGPNDVKAEDDDLLTKQFKMHHFYSKGIFQFFFFFKKKLSFKLDHLGFHIFCTYKGITKF